MLKSEDDFSHIHTLFYTKITMSVCCHKNESVTLLMKTLIYFNPFHRSLPEVSYIQFQNTLSQRDNIQVELL